MIQYLVYDKGKFIGYTSIKQYAKRYKSENPNHKIKILKIDDIPDKLEPKYHLVEFNGYIMSIEEFEFLEKMFFNFSNKTLDNLVDISYKLKDIRFNDDENKTIKLFRHIIQMLSIDNYHHVSYDIWDLNLFIKDFRTGKLTYDEVKCDESACISE